LTLPTRNDQPRENTEGPHSEKVLTSDLIHVLWNGERCPKGSVREEVRVLGVKAVKALPDNGTSRFIDIRIKIRADPDTAAEHHFQAST